MMKEQVKMPYAIIWNGVNNVNEMNVKCKMFGLGQGEGGFLPLSFQNVLNLRRKQKCLNT